MPDKTNHFLINLPAIHRAVHRWYKTHGRAGLPWRNTSDPYAIYVSEIMLQQTQVKTVLERYYSRFLERFPTLAALAKADRQEVMKAWEGLGYYTRAANLHAAAQQCGGKLPEAFEALLALPGIGRNTASAVACFAFGTKLPVMEANVRRILCRVFALKIVDERTLWNKAMLLLDSTNPFDYNQAMMDIGAMICTKRAPHCAKCPLNAICKGKGATEQYPAPKQAKITSVRKRAIVAFGDGKGSYYLARRSTRFLGGLYGFMEYEEGMSHVIFRGKKYRLEDKDKIGEVTQTYSHFTLQAKVYQLKAAASAPPPDASMCKVKLRDIMALPLSRADQKIVTLLLARL